MYVGDNDPASAPGVLDTGGYTFGTVGLQLTRPVLLTGDAVLLFRKHLADPVTHTATPQWVGLPPLPPAGSCDPNARQAPQHASSDDAATLSI